jgi:hypothetical protein
MIVVSVNNFPKRLTVLFPFALLSLLVFRKIKCLLDLRFSFQGKAAMINEVCPQ